jgi:hypothetical protein
MQELLTRIKDEARHLIGKIRARKMGVNTQT